MDIWAVIETLLVVALAPIALGVVSNAFWEWVRNTVPYRSSRDIPLKGAWQVESAYHHQDGRIENLSERLEILHQFGRRFRGRLHTPHPLKPGENIVLEVRGEFLDKFHAVFSYRHDSSSLTDMGAGVLQFEANHDVAEGGSTNFGISSNWKTANTTFVMRRL